jgi:hypothetical protein
MMNAGGDGFAFGFWEGRPHAFTTLRRRKPCRPVPIREGLALRSTQSRILDFYVISKLLAGDTEVAPPE